MATNTNDRRDARATDTPTSLREGELVSSPEGELSREASAEPIRTGSQVLLVYPEGDADTVTVVELTHAQVVVRLPDGRLYATVHEDIGLGVDDELTFVLDDGCTADLGGFHHVTDGSPEPGSKPKSWLETDPTPWLVDPVRFIIDATPEGWVIVDTKTGQTLPHLYPSQDAAFGPAVSLEAEAILTRAQTVTGQSNLRQGAASQWLLSARVELDGHEVGHAAGWFERNDTAFRGRQWSQVEALHGPALTDAWGTRGEAHADVIRSARTMALLTIVRSLHVRSSSRASTPTPEQRPVSGQEGAASVSSNDPIWAAGYGGQYDPDTAVWDDLSGETYRQARERFATFGPLLTAEQAARLLTLQPGATVMSFGYGQDPEDFDGIEAEELDEAIARDGAEAVMSDWGPFAIWQVEGDPSSVDELRVDHVRGEHDDESDPACGDCQALYDEVASSPLATAYDAAYVDEYLRVLVEQASQLRVDLARSSDPARDVESLFGYFARQGATDVRPASARAFRDLATGLAAATSIARVR